MENITKIKSDVARLREQLAQAEERLQEAEAAEAALTDEQRLAVALHDELCTWNHADGCGWFYEFTGKQHDWSRSAHDNYLMKAGRLIHLCGSVDAAQRALASHRLVKSA